MGEKRAAPIENAAQEETPGEMDYFFSIGFCSTFFSGAFIVLSVAVGFISLPFSAASVTPAKATVRNRAQTRDSIFFIGVPSIGDSDVTNERNVHENAAGKYNYLFLL